MSDFGEHDAAALRRAVEIARRGRGWVEPNPCVGAVLYRGAKILAEGWHREYGELHAERDLLCTDAARESLPPKSSALLEPVLEPASEQLSLAVTLEPCSSHGKQPPCTEALLQHGVCRVVIGQIDPDPRHRGSAVEALRAAGCEVIVAPEGAVDEDLLKEFRESLERERPEVVLKWATALDGSWGPASGVDRWISNEESRALAHRLRAHVDAILVGSGTLLRDDPELSARPPGRRPLLRVVLDGRGRLRADHRLACTPEKGTVLQVTRPGTALVPGVERCELDDPHDLDAVLSHLRVRGVQRLLVEGGPRVVRACLDAGVVDRAWVFVAPVLFGGDEAGGPGLWGPDAPVVTRRPRVEELRAVGCDAWYRLRF